MRSTGRSRRLAAPFSSLMLAAAMILLMPARTGPPAAALVDPPIPSVSVATAAVYTYPGDTYVFLNDWEPATPVHLEIDVPPLGSVDETYDVVIDEFRQYGFVRPGERVLPPSTVVTASGGGVVKELLVGAFRPERLDATADVIAGYAPETTQLTVLVPDTVGGNPPRFETTAIAGPGDTWSTSTLPYDLQLGDAVEVRLFDGDGDFAYTNQTVRTPRINASVTYAPPGGQPEYFWVDDWVPGTALHLEVNSDATGEPEWTRDMIYGIDDSGSNLGSVGLLQVGSLVTATGGGWTKQVEIVEVRVEYLNEATEVAAGVAPAGGTVWIAVNKPGSGPPIYSTTVPADDVTGWWRLDLTGLADLERGDTVTAAIIDDDADWVGHGLNVTTPWIDGYFSGAGGDVVGFQFWPAGTPFTMTVDVEPDGTIDAVFTDLNPQCQCIMIPGGGPELQVGSMITVTADNGVAPDRWERALTIEHVGVTGFDIASDLVSGFAPNDGRTVTVDVNTGQWGPPPSISGVAVDQDGNWTADFGGLVDLQPGMFATVHLADGDGDRTSAGLPIDNPQPPVELWVWPTVGLWDGRTVDVHAAGLTPGTAAFVSVNVAANPTGAYQILGQLWVGQDGMGSTQVDVPRWIDGTDCAAAPGTCILVVADQPDPFGRNAEQPLTFARIDLFRFTPNDPDDPWGDGVIGAPVDQGEVAHLESVWVAGSGFEPWQASLVDQCGDSTVGFETESQVLCRNNPRWVFSDENGSFGTVLQLGRNVFGAPGTAASLAISPAWDLIDGQTVVVTADGLPRGPWGADADCGGGNCFVGAYPQQGALGPNPVPYRSQPLTFSGDPQPIHVWIGQALEQQLLAIVHIDSADGAMREVSWDRESGTLVAPHTATSRWLDPGDDVWDPAPKENGWYDCADTLEPVADGQEPVHCSMLLIVTEGDSSPDLTHPVASATWTSMEFARLDLKASVTSAKLSTSPAGVRISGTVSCTGFVPTQYLVHIAGTVTQTVGKGRNVTTLNEAFSTDVTCSGTILNPGTTTWTVLVPGGFKTGAATITIDVTSPGFTRTADPLHIVQPLMIQTPPKGKGK